MPPCPTCAFVTIVAVNAIHKIAVMFIITVVIVIIIMVIMVIVLMVVVFDRLMGVIYQQLSIHRFLLFVAIAVKAVLLSHFDRQSAYFNFASTMKETSNVTTLTGRPWDTCDHLTSTQTLKAVTVAVHCGITPALILLLGLPGNILCLCVFWKVEQYLC